MADPTPGGQSTNASGKDRVAASAEILETEWQYDAPDLGVLRTWLTEHARSGPLRVFPGNYRRIRDLYLDTPDLRILRAGYALRIRRTAKSAEASLKELAPRTGSLAVRREITKPLASADSAALFEGQDPVTERLRLLCRKEELKALGAIRTLRQIYQITHAAEDPAGSGDARLPTAEIALDRTFVIDSLGHVHRLSRLEIEVRHEYVQIFQTLADRLRDECGLRAAEQSKFEWAMQATGILVDRTMSFGAMKIDGSTSVGQVADAVLRKHLAAFLWNEPGTRLGDDLEYLHHMRVAARRLRAALKLFRMAYPDGEADRLRSALGEFGRQLGEVRDLDVFIDEIKGLRGGLVSVDATACDPMLLHLARNRDRAREKMIESLDSPAFGALRHDLAGLLHAGPPAGRPGADEPITRFGPPIILRAHARVMRVGRRLALDSPAERYHEMRIQSRRLRYILEFLEDVYGDSARELVATLVEVQDLLGLHQDAWVSANKLRTIASEKPVEFTSEGWVALGELSQVYHSRVTDLRLGLGCLLKRIGRRRWRALKRQMKMLHTEKKQSGDKNGAQRLPQDLPREHP